MNKLFLSIVLLVTQAAFANEPQCVDQTVRQTVMHNFSKFGASTNSCGIKALNIGDFLETYLVCSSDETEPTEYVVVVNADTCETAFIDAATEASTPNFNTDGGLLESVECSIDGYDSQLTCR